MAKQTRRRSELPAVSKNWKLPEDHDDNGVLIKRPKVLKARRHRQCSDKRLTHACVRGRLRPLGLTFIPY